MISLNQIRLLEQKVESILQLVERLQNEKSVLERENADLKSDSQKLRAKCADLEEAEGKIEEGILSVLNRLNDMEDAIQNASNKEPVAPSQPVKAEASADEQSAVASATESISEQASTPQAAIPEEHVQTPNTQLDIF